MLCPRKNIVATMNGSKYFKIKKMQCSVCCGAIKKQSYICSDCLDQTVRERSEAYHKLKKRRDELKEKLETAILPREQQSLNYERNIRAQKHKNQLLREYIKQLQQENNNQDQINRKIYADHQEKQRQFERAREELLSAVREHKEIVFRAIKERNEKEIHKYVERYIKNRRRLCISLFDSFPIFTDSVTTKGRILSTAKSTTSSTKIINIHITSGSDTTLLYFCNKDFSLPIGVISEGFDLIKAVQNDTENKLVKTLPSMLGNMVLLLNELSCILQHPLPFPMVYWGSKSYVRDLEKTELTTRVIDTGHTVEINDSMNISTLSSSVVSESEDGSPVLQTSLRKYLVPEPIFKVYPLYEQEPGDTTPLKSPRGNTENSSGTPSSSSSDSLKSPSKTEIKELVTPKDKFVKGLKLLNDNILALCHGQGIMVSNTNENNLFHNLVILYHFENIGRIGPYSFVHTNSKGNSDNVYMDNETTKKVFVYGTGAPTSSSTTTNIKKNKTVIGGVLDHNYLKE